MDKWFAPLAAGLGTLLSYLYGGWSEMLGVLVAFLVIDYVSGVAAAWREKRLSSEEGARGIAKKLGILLLVAVGHLIDRSTGGAHLVRDAATWFYTANELLSVIENAGRSGIPIPPIIRQAVAVLQGRAGGGGGGPGPNPGSEVSGR